MQIVFPEFPEHFFKKIQKKFSKNFRFGLIPEVLNIRLSIALMFWNRVFHS